MRKEVFRNAFVYFEFDEQSRVFYAVYLPETKKLNDDLFKHIVYEQLKYVSHYQPTYYLDNALELNYPVSPSLQTWSIELIVPKWIGIGVRKYAQVVPKDFIVNLSMEQVVDEGVAFGIPIETKFFDNEQDALVWFAQ